MNTQEVHMSKLRRRTPPPGFGRPELFRSPNRSNWLTSVLSLVLLIGIPVLIVTGLLSYAAYDPRLGAPNLFTPKSGLIQLYLFNWPTEPVWLYRASQGVHVVLG
jgi:hypothetical protein